MKHTGTHPDIPIVYEDNHLLIIDKPHELLSQADPTGDPDVLSLCKSYLKREQGKSGSVYLGLIHRLDRPTGGLMVLAKTSNAAKRLSRQFRDRTVQKVYHAVVQGDPPVNGILVHHLSKNRDSNIVEVVPPGDPGGKRAELSFQTLKHSGELSLLAVHLQTGRPHQIRVQLAAEGFPIWGDYKYGLQQPDGRTMALRSVEIRLVHPVQQEEMDFKLPPPADEPWDRFLDSAAGTE